MNKINERLNELEELRKVREKRNIGDDIGLRVKSPKKQRLLNHYNYKIKKIGDYVEAYKYDEPIYCGYKRKHKTERKEGRTMANEQNVKRARKNVYDIVNCNITQYTKMLTLTYAQTMLDYDKLYNDFKAFMKQLKRKGIITPYLAITEHQTKRGKKEGNKGSLHLHVLLFTDEFIPFKVLKECWGSRGSVHIEKIDEASNKGAYVAKYITKETMPPDKKSYRTSREIKKPTYTVGLGDELDIINSLKGYEFINESNYTKIKGINQETGEIKESNVTVSKYQRNK